MNRFLMKSKLKRLGKIRDKVFDDYAGASWFAAVAASVFFTCSPIKGALETETSAVEPKGNAEVVAQMQGKLQTMQSLKAAFEKSRAAGDGTETEKLRSELKLAVYDFDVGIYTAPQLSERDFKTLAQAYKEKVNISTGGEPWYNNVFGKGANYRDECLQKHASGTLDLDKQSENVASCMKNRSAENSAASVVGGITGSVGLGLLGFGAAGWATRRRPEKPKTPKN